MRRGPSPRLIRSAMRRCREPRCLQLLPVRQISQALQPEGHQKCLGGYQGIGRSAPGAAGDDGDQVARVWPLDQVMADLIAEDLLQPIPRERLRIGAPPAPRRRIPAGRASDRPHPPPYSGPRPGDPVRGARAHAVQGLWLARAVRMGRGIGIVQLFAYARLIRRSRFLDMTILDRSEGRPLTSLWEILKEYFMDQNTRAALDQTIQRWQRNRIAIVPDQFSVHGQSRGELCDSFRKDGCNGCPVSAKTGQPECSGTPLGEAVVAFTDWRQDPLNLHAMVDALECADRMSEFLSGLVPVWRPEDAGADQSSKEGSGTRVGA